MPLSRHVFFVPVVAGALLAEAGLAEAQEAAYRPADGALVQLEGEGGCVSGKSDQGCAQGRALDNAVHVAMSPDDKSVYVTSAGPAGKGVAVFAREPGTGRLTQLAGADGCIDDGGAAGCASGRALQGPNDIALSPDGRHVYVTTTFVASAGSGGVAVFARDLGTGAIVQLDGEDGCVDSNGEDGCAQGRAVGAARGVAVSLDGRSVYVASLGDPWAVAVFGRDLGTGALTQLDGEAGCVARNRYAGCGHGRALDAPQDVAVSPDGSNVYVAGSQAVAVFARDHRTGALRQLRDRDACVHAEGEQRCAGGRALGEGVSVAVSPDGDNVYVAAEALVVFARDRKTGALNQLRRRYGCVSDDGERCAEGRAIAVPSEVAVSPDGRSVYVASLQGVAVFARDRKTGALSQLDGQHGCLEIGGGGGCIAARAIDFATGVAVSRDGRSAYVASGISDAVAVFARR